VCFESDAAINVGALAGFTAGVANGSTPLTITVIAAESGEETWLTATGSTVETSCTASPTAAPTGGPATEGPTWAPTTTPTSVPTMAPTADACGAIACALQCENRCAWDTLNGRCRDSEGGLYATTAQARADRLGNCTLSPTRAPTATPTQTPTVFVMTIDNASAGTNGDSTDNYPYAIMAVAAALALCVIVALLVFARRRKDKNVDANVVYAQPPAPLALFNPPTYLTSTAATRRPPPPVAAWQPPTAPAYRPPPRYGGMQISEPKICSHSSGVVLPGYAPAPSYRQALFISTRQSSALGGRGAPLPYRAPAAYQSPPRFGAAASGMAVGGATHSAPAYADPPSFSSAALDGAARARRGNGSNSLNARGSIAAVKPAPAYEEPPEVFFEDIGGGGGGGAENMR
jgi:hypothetical protein